MQHLLQALSGDFQCAYGKMHVQILLGVWWCVMSIFLFLKFYNFIKGIMRIHSIFKKPKTNVFILHLLTFYFSLISNATNFFIHSLNRFILKKNTYALLVFFDWVPYMQLSQMIPGVNIIDRKVSVASVNRAGGSGGVLRPHSGPVWKFLGSKEHLNWLKIDLDTTEIIIIQDYKHTQN